MQDVDRKLGGQNAVGGPAGVCFTFAGERSVLPASHATGEIGMARAMP